MKIACIFITKADNAEKTAHLPPLRSNAMAAAQGARVAALQELDQKLVQTLDYLDAENETAMLPRLCSNLGLPKIAFLRHKLEIAAQNE